MLPQEVAQMLRAGQAFEPRHHKNMTLFFSDVVGFTGMCTELPPWDIIDMLNRLYTVMDFLAERFCLYKVETVSNYGSVNQILNCYDPPLTVFRESDLSMPDLDW
jgi:class 3 adenylate cyclase